MKESIYEPGILGAIPDSIDAKQCMASIDELRKFVISACGGM
jgi:hypothetical protein